MVAIFFKGAIMYLTNEQRYALANKMLSIVEHMVFRKTDVKIPILNKHVNNDEDMYDSALNDLINEQLRAVGSEIMNEVQDELPR